MKQILGISAAIILAVGLSGCTKEPNLKEVEGAMRDEFKQVFPETMDVNQLVILQKIKSCKKQKDGFVCVVEASEKMAPSPDGKNPSLIEVTVRKEGDKWVTVKDDAEPSQK